jgi:xylulokinase
VLLVIDIGTSNFKAALFDYQGNCRSFAAQPMVMGVEENPAGEGENGGPSAEEANPEQWLRAFAGTLSRLDSPAAVEAVVISGNGPTLTPVTGRPGITAGGDLSLPAGMARLWLDRRATVEAKTVSALTGGFVDPGFFLPKALLLKSRDPGLYEKTRWFLSPAEYLACALTGEARTVLPSAGFERWYWNDGLLDATGLDREKFPPFIPPGECIGLLSGAAASRFGFSREVRVIAGGPDFFVSILGTGAVRPGAACDRSGTSEGINLCTENRVRDSRLMCYGHPVSPYWNLSGIISTSGRAIRWGRELLGMEKLPYPAFYELAAAAPAGAGGLIFLPYLAGERAPIWDPRARGVFLGLSLSTGRRELARAIVEGVCFAIRDVITVMEEAGAPLRDLRVSGGPGESPVFNQLKADISGRPVLLPARRDAELLGLTMLGAAAMGKYASAGEAAGALVSIVREYAPAEQHASRYDRLFEDYRGLYRSLKAQFANNLDSREDNS